MPPRRVPAGNVNRSPAELAQIVRRIKKRHPSLSPEQIRKAARFATGTYEEALEAARETALRRKRR